MAYIENNQLVLTEEQFYKEIKTEFLKHLSIEEFNSNDIEIIDKLYYHTLIDSLKFTRQEHIKILVKHYVKFEKKLLSEFKK